jgi:ring-1,2-phenylacetyl-CoA epoxidase subunit PaaE
MSKDFHKLKVIQLKKETQQAISITFDVPDQLRQEFQFKSGQYLTLKATIDGEEIRRSYSICSSPSEGSLTVTSKIVKGGKMSNYLFHRLSVGDELSVMSPDGNFKLSAEDAPVVFFAAGSGITPVLSMLKDSLENRQQEVQLYYGNRSEEDIIFKDEIKNLQQQYPDRLLVQHFLSSSSERIDAERIQAFCETEHSLAQQAHFYICGPSGMIQSTEEALKNNGVDKHRIHIEYFSAPDTDQVKKEVVASGKPEDIIVVLDGEEHQLHLNSGETILEGAERLGIDPPYSCQSGVCTTCKAKVLQGEVSMENNFGLSEEEEAEGFVLTCIGTPASAGVKISWDEA